jgi:hypothetical protein
MPHRFGNLTLYHQPSSNPHHRPYTKGQAKKAGDQNPCLKGGGDWKRCWTGRRKEQVCGISRHLLPVNPRDFRT